MTLMIHRKKMASAAKSAIPWMHLMSNDVVSQQIINHAGIDIPTLCNLMQLIKSKNQPCKKHCEALLSVFFFQDGKDINSLTLPLTGLMLPEPVSLCMPTS